MRAKKHLGQNFLTSKAVVADIVKAARLSKDDVVLEIGPGKGTLTDALLANTKKVIAIEKDADLFEFLQSKFSNEIRKDKLTLIHGDILDIDHSHHTFDTVHYKLVANIPYYITGQLLRKVLWIEHRPSLMVLMLQKEVAKRITAQDGKESILSISIKAYGKPRYIKKVPARYFSPKPKVDSAILAITNIRSPFEGRDEEKHFFDIIHRGFAHKRKFLKRNLACSESDLAQCGVEEDARAENVTLDQWTCLAENLK